MRAPRLRRAFVAGALAAAGLVEGKDAAAQLVAVAPQQSVTFTVKPTVGDITEVGIGGGLAAVLGHNFIVSSANLPRAEVFLSGFPGPATALTVGFNSSTSMTITLAAGSYTAGSYPVRFTFPNSDIVFGSLAITTSLTPLQIFGGCLTGDWPSSSCTCASTCITGSAVVTCPDTSGNGQDKTLVSTPAPTVQLNDALFQQPNVTSIVGVQASETFVQRAVFSFGDAGIAFGLFEAANTTAVPAFGLFDQYLVAGTPNINVGINATTGILQAGWGGNAAVTTVDGLNLGVILSADYEQDGGFSLSVNNATKAFGTAPAGYNIDGGGVLTTLNSSAVNDGWSGHLVRDWALNCTATPTQVTEANQFLNNTYGITLAPGFQQATPVPALTVNAPLRILNSLTNYSTGTNVFLVQGSTQTACTTQSTTTTQWIDLLCPSVAAGTYDLLIENPDGRAATFSGVITATTQTSDWSIFGLDDIASFIPIPANLTCSPSPCISGTSLCSSWLDAAALGNTITQATTADQFTWFSGVGDSTFNFQPYVVMNGTTTFMATPGNMVLDSPTDFWTLAVYIPGATGGVTNISRMAGSSLSLTQFSSTNVPECYYAGTEPAWSGGTVTGAHSFVCGATMGSPGSVSINVDNGTATSSSASISLSSGGILTIGRNTTIQYANGKLAAQIYLRKAPSPTKLAAWQTLVSSTWL